MAADTRLATLTSPGVSRFGLVRRWAQMEKLPGDAHHAKASTKNARLIRLHLARLPCLLVETITSSSGAGRFLWTSLHDPLGPCARPSGRTRVESREELQHCTP